MKTEQSPNGMENGSFKSLQFNTSSTIQLTGANYDTKEKQIDLESDNQPAKDHPTTDLDAALHMVKSELGSGILASANGFKHAGTLVGVIGTIFVGILGTHSMNIMVKSSQEMCRMLNKPFLGYTETIEYSLLYCANKKFSKYATLVRNFVEYIMFFTYYGVNTVYVVLVASVLQTIIESHFDVHYNIRLYICMITIPIFLVGIVRSMKYLVPFSAVANVFFIVGLCLTFYFIFQDLPPISSRPLAVKITHFPIFFSTVIFGMEGIGTVLPIENSMKHPHHFLGCPGVLNVAMTVIVTLFCSIGFFGYVKFGDKIEANITLNLPRDALAETVKCLIGLGVLFSYGLQMTVSMEVLWKKLEDRFDKNEQKKRYYQIRSLMIIGTVLLAIAVPNIGPVISLIGAVGFSMCGLFFPPMCELVIRWERGFGKWNYILWKNILFFLITIFAVIAGSITSMADIINEYS